MDDQPQNLRLLDAVLTPRGYRVITAASGEEAVGLLIMDDRRVRARRDDHGRRDTKQAMAIYERARRILLDEARDAAGR